MWLFFFFHDRYPLKHEGDVLGLVIFMSSSSIPSSCCSTKKVCIGAAGSFCFFHICGIEESPYMEPAAKPMARSNRERDKSTAPGPVPDQSGQAPDSNLYDVILPQRHQTCELACWRKTLERSLRNCVLLQLNEAIADTPHKPSRLCCVLLVLVYPPL